MLVEVGSILRRVKVPFDRLFELAAVRTAEGQFARGTIWNVLGSLIARFITLITAILLARALGREDYGIYGMVLGAVGIFQSLGGFGTGLTATRYLSLLRCRDPIRAGRILAMSDVIAWSGSLLMAGLLFSLAPILATSALRTPDLVVELRITSLILLLAIWNGTQIGILNGFEAFKHVAYINTLSAITIGFSTIIGATLGGVKGALIGNAISMLLVCIYSQFVIVKFLNQSDINWQLRIDVDIWRVLISFGIPSSLATFFITPASWVASAFISREVGGFSQIACFNAANQWRIIILFFPSIIASSALPFLSRLSIVDAQEQNKVRTLSLYATVISAALSAVLVILMAPHLMQFYGRDFYSGASALRILALGAVLGAIVNLYSHFIIANGEMWKGFFLNFIWGSTLVATAFSVRQYGAQGLALAYLVAHVAHWITMLCMKRTAHRHSSQAS